MNCIICQNLIPKDHKICCSYKCFQEYSKNNRRIYLNCKNCNKEYSKKKSEKPSTFCSLKCRSEYGRVGINCETCNKSIKVFKSRLTKNNYCSRKCFYIDKSIKSLGENNPNFRNGSRVISRIIRGLSKSLKWRNEVIERDKNTCQFCKQQFGKKDLEAHHIIRLWKLIEDYPHDKINFHDEYFYQTSNGMTLCKPCHKKTYGKDEDNIDNEFNSVDTLK